MLFSYAISCNELAIRMKQTDSGADICKKSPFYIIMKLFEIVFEVSFVFREKCHAKGLTIAIAVDDTADSIVTSQMNSTVHSWEV